MRILLIGPLPVANDVLGGTKVLFHQLVNYFAQSSFWYCSVLNTTRPRQSNIWMRIFNNLNLFCCTIWKVWKLSNGHSIIMLNASPRGILSMGPLIWFITRLKNRPLVIRLFGGDFEDFLVGVWWINKALARKTFLRSNLILLETKVMVERMSSLCSVRWLPNSREIDARCVERKQCRKLLFVSQLRPEKGIREVVEICDALPAALSVSVYGAPMPGFDASVFDSVRKLTYFGEAPFEEIPDIMARHDLLVFPSYYSGEGYPGVIIEALQSGLPVIATDWKFIPEIIEHEKNGLLIEPRSKTQLLNGIVRLHTDEALYRKLSTGALETGQRFRSNTINTELDLVFQDLVGTGRPSVCAE